MACGQSKPPVLGYAAMARFWLIAGPNGVGKTAYAWRHLLAATGTLQLVNLDEISRGLSPLAPQSAARAAGRVALARARELMEAGVTFAMETTLSGYSQLGLVSEARRHGLSVGLLFFTVPSVEICLERIARRVTEGGHDVPPADVRRRFARGIARFPSYAKQADLWRVIDNSRTTPAVVAEGAGTAVRFAEPERLRNVPQALADALARF